MKKCGAVKPGPDAGTAWPRRSQIRFCGETFLRRDEMGGGGTGRHGRVTGGWGVQVIRKQGWGDCDLTKSRNVFPFKFIFE